MKYYPTIILLLFAFHSINAQYGEQEYPFNISYAANKTVNVRFSIARNTNLEGSEYVNFEMPSLSFSLLQNPYDKKEFFFSLNPLIWAISTLTNSGEMVNSGGGMPGINLLFEGIPNLKFDIVFSNNFFLNFGLDMDYLASTKSVGLRGGYAAGIKVKLNEMSLRLMYNWEAIGFVSYYKDFSSSGLRIDFSYDLGSNSFSRFVYYCGVTN